VRCPAALPRRGRQPRISRTGTWRFPETEEDAGQCFEAALLAGLSRWPSSAPRLLLAYGRWLRRQRRIESRAPLRTARDVFGTLSYDSAAEHARRDLRASGESSRRRDAHARDQLAPQQLQIAHLAAQGLSNREIGQTLYLSHRTVGTHLYRLFPKLGITDWRELAAALGNGRG
jgi:DNA-binding CsgD family transcriptional regulator